MVRKTLSWRDKHEEGERERLTVREEEMGQSGVVKSYLLHLLDHKIEICLQRIQEYIPQEKAADRRGTHAQRQTHFRWIYQAALEDLGPLQSYCNAVGEDEGQHHVVKQLMGYDGLAYLSEPG